VPTGCCGWQIQSGLAVRSTEVSAVTLSPELQTRLLPATPVWVANEWWNTRFRWALTCGTETHAIFRSHCEVILLALLGLMHVRFALTILILGRAWRIDQRGIHDGALAQRQIPVA